MNQQSSVQIESSPEVRNGKPHVTGTRITVSDIVIWTEQGQSPDEIVTDYPQVSLSQVHAALAYYYAHQAEIDQQIKDSESFIAGLKKQREQGSSPLGKGLDGDSISS